MRPIENERHDGRRLDIPQREGPWDRPGTLYFYGGREKDLSSFAPTPGLWLPESWFGHPRPSPLVEVPTNEHWFHASKGTNREDFFWVLAAPTPAQAKRRGRKIALRPDWEEVKVSVMRFANRGKFSLPRYRETLPATGDRVLVEDSPTDYAWGGRDGSGGYGGMNLLGIALMEVRAELAHAAA